MDCTKLWDLKKEIVLILNLTDHYFTGEYPVKPIIDESRRSIK